MQFLRNLGESQCQNVWILLPFLLEASSVFRRIIVDVIIFAFKRLYMHDLDSLIFFLAKLSFQKSEKVDFTDIQPFPYIYFKFLFSLNNSNLTLWCRPPCPTSVLEHQKATWPGWPTPVCRGWGRGLVHKFYHTLNNSITITTANPKENTKKLKQNTNHKNELNLRNWQEFNNPN